MSAVASILAAHGMTSVPNHEPSMWLRGRLADLNARWSTGIEPCEHLTRPVGTVAALWAPHRLVCGDCAHKLKLTGDADHTCDRCGSVVPVIHPHIVFYGAVVMFGLCPDCHRREVGA